MSNYTKSTNFTSKDSLSSGNPLKIIKGAEFDTEFNAISTAVATKADASSGTLTSPTITTPTINGMNSSIITSGTAVTTTSGTNVDFTGVPSWVKRITVNFYNVSLSANSSFLVQLGTSGGFTTSGYIGYNARFTVSAVSSGSLSSGFVLIAGDSTQNFSGSLVICLQNGNTWVATGGCGGSAVSSFVAGGVPLSAALTQVRITTVSGTDAFDAGSINILYE